MASRRPPQRPPSSSGAAAAPPAPASARRKAPPSSSAASASAPASSAPLYAPMDVAALMSSSQNLPAALNDPRRGKRKDFFTRWGQPNS